ncbi:MAG: Omp28 family outer membrane lipoprotein [Muribaculaceae bacterium]|nr:Omp28 family outer membrane lipoprotein [Muribaculaceae bacterium]
MKIFNKISAIALACIALTACNEVDPDDRFEELPAVSCKRTVLLEEFTGQECTNCPDAHRLVANLHEQYGEQLVSVAIHAGQYLEVDIWGNYFQVLKIEPDGDEYAKTWNVAGYPSAVVNRRSGTLSIKEVWTAWIRDEITRESPIELAVKAHIDDDGNIAIETDVKGLSAVKGKLQLWITESGIKSYQVDGGKRLTDYEHNHVYRASVNGLWGEDLSLNNGEERVLSHSYTPRDIWVKSNLAVVAFVYTDADGVLQAAECKVTE